MFWRMKTRVVGCGVDERPNEDTQIYRALTVNQHRLNITRLTSMLVLNLTVTVHGLLLLTKITKRLHGTDDVHYARLIKSVQAHTLRIGLIGLVDARPRGEDLSAVRLHRK